MPFPMASTPSNPCSALVPLQDALLSLGAALDASALRDALRHALVTLLPAVVGGRWEEWEQSVFLGWGLLRPPGLGGALEGVETGLSAGWCWGSAWGGVSLFPVHC